MFQKIYFQKKKIIKISVFFGTFFQAYFCLCFTGKETGNEPDIAEQIFWSYKSGTSENVAIQKKNNLVMMGIKVQLSKF